MLRSTIAVCPSHGEYNDYGGNWGCWKCRAEKKKQDDAVSRERMLEHPNGKVRVLELDMSTRVRNALVNDNIEYLADIAIQSEGEMLRIPNFGRKSLNEVKTILDEHGMRFGMTKPDTVLLANGTDDVSVDTAAPPQAPHQAHDLGLRYFDELPIYRRKEIAGKTNLPRSNNASRPMYYHGNTPPRIPPGTKISVWCGSYWVPQSVNAHTWRKPCVFRLRDASATLTSVKRDAVAVEPLDRIANALERIAAALEAE